jgi:glutamate-1-semialdehyde 2,1-aminomutase
MYTKPIDELNSEELFERALLVAPGGVHSPVRGFQSVGGKPIFFKSGLGAKLTSVEGDEYIDFCQSFGPLIFGHQDPDVKKAVLNMLDTIWTSGTCEPYSLRLAEWLKCYSPSVDKLRFVSSGTEAVMSAIRVARGATKKDKIIKFEGCYHGHVDSLLVKSGSGLAGESASDSAGVSALLAAQTLVLPLDDEAAFKECIDKNKNEVAAVILEPLPANFGLLVQRPEFIKFVTEYAQKNDVLVIFDEVISGFRTAFGGMAEILNLKPDLVTYGKVLGGGLPVGCYGGRKDLMDFVAPLGPVYQAGTLSASPLGMAAGHAQLKKMADLKVHEVLEQRGKVFQDYLTREIEAQSWPIQMVRFGSLFWFVQKTNEPIRQVSKISNGHKEFFKHFFKHLIEERIFMAPNGYEVGFIGYAHTPEILKLAADKIIRALDKTYKGL